MILGEDKSLTAGNILKLVSEYDIYRLYLGHDFQFKKLYPSPFRQETKGSFGIICTSSGSLRHRDFGNSLYNGNCFHFVEQLFGMNFNQALNKINQDMNLGLIPTISNINREMNLNSPEIRDIVRYIGKPELTFKPRATIHVVSKPFSQKELEYWKKYGITKGDLDEERIFSVKDLYVNGILIHPEEDDKMRFAYLFTDEEGVNYIKIYSPFSKDFKWLSNVPVRKVLNLDKLPKINKTIIVIKSKKDKIVLKKIYPDVYEVQKEGTECIPEELDSFFDEYYDNKVCFFDNDEPGKTANKLLNPLGYGWINIPNEYAVHGLKDPSDIIAHFGEEIGYGILKDLLRKKGIIE